MTKDLTQGNLYKNIITFSLPFLLSYFLQTLYGMADLFIVGQYNGASSISGVSIGSQFMHMVTVMLVSLSLGSVVRQSQRKTSQYSYRKQYYTLFLSITHLAYCIALL